jgi:hypothetical protein
MLSVQEQKSRDTIKEHPATWLENVTSVFRDWYGQFASKGSKVAQDIGEQSVIDSSTRAMIKTDPEETKLALQSFIDLEKSGDARNWFAEGWDNLGKGFQDAIRNSPLQIAIDGAKSAIEAIDSSPVGEAARKVSKVITDIHEAYLGALNQLNNLDSDSKILNTLGKVAAFGISAGVFMSTMLIPEVAIANLFVNQFRLAKLYRAGVTAVEMGATAGVANNQLREYFKGQQEVKEGEEPSLSFIQSVGIAAAAAGMGVASVLAADELLKFVGNTALKYVKKGGSKKLTLEIPEGRTRLQCAASSRCEVIAAIKKDLPKQEKRVEELRRSHEAMLRRKNKKLEASFSPIQNEDLRLRARTMLSRSKFKNPGDYDVLAKSADLKLEELMLKSEPHMKLTEYDAINLMEGRYRGDKTGVVHDAFSIYTPRNSREAAFLERAESVQKGVASSVGSQLEQDSVKSVIDLASNPTSPDKIGKLLETAFSGDPKKLQQATDELFQFERKLQEGAKQVESLKEVTKAIVKERQHKLLKVKPFHPDLNIKKEKDVLGDKFLDRWAGHPDTSNSLVGPSISYGHLSSPEGVIAKAGKRGVDIKLRPHTKETALVTHGSLQNVADNALVPSRASKPSHHSYLSGNVATETEDTIKDTLLKISSASNLEELEKSLGNKITQTNHLVPLGKGDIESMGLPGLTNKEVDMISGLAESHNYDMNEILRMIRRLKKENPDASIRGFIGGIISGSEGALETLEETIDLMKIAKVHDIEIKGLRGT